MTEGRDCEELLCLDLPHAERIRAGLPGTPVVERAAAVARALADPTRLTIATALLDGSALCVCDMSWVVGAARNLASHHLRQLKVAGVVSARRDGRMVMYTLTDHGRAALHALINPDATDPRTPRTGDQTPSGLSCRS